ncbi:MAG: hypothetical protein AAFP98_06025 [Pseudomonadota bacterium]
MSNRLIRIATRVIFVLSLLLNAVIIGIALQIAELRSYYGPAETRLPREIRRNFVDTAKADDTLAQEAALLSAARTEMFDLSQATPLDREALEAAMANVRAQTANLQERSQALLLETIVRLRSEQ